MLDQINNISRKITQEIKKILSKLKIRITVEDFMLLYDIYNKKKQSISISSVSLAEQSQYILQQIIFQVQTLENRKFIDLGENNMLLAYKDIHISKMSLLEEIFNKVERELQNKNIKITWKKDSVETNV